jgi:DNA polymerase-4
MTQHIHAASDIRHAAGQCLKRVDLTRRIRLLGVRVGSLMKLEEWQVKGQEAKEASPAPYTESLF